MSSLPRMHRTMLKSLTLISIPRKQRKANLCVQDKSGIHRESLSQIKQNKKFNPGATVMAQ